MRAAACRSSPRSLWTQLYYVSFVLLIVATLIIWRLLRSRYGMALTAVRDDEEAARTVGIDIRRMKTVVFLLAGTFTGLAAGLYYLDAVIITPPSGFDVSWSAYFVFVVVAGGMGTLPGPIIGAIIFVIVDRLIAGYAGHGLLILGLASIIIMFVMPRGLMGIVNALRHLTPEEAAHGRTRLQQWLQVLLGVSGRPAGAGADSQPGVVAAFLVPGNPLPMLCPENPPWKVLVEGYQAARKAVAAAKPDVILLYSTQWIAVLDQLWQGKPRISGLHVDENWHEYGNLRYDLRIDVNLAKACVAAATEAGIKSKLVDYDSFPIDTGTIVANAFLNPDKEIPVLVAANNLYHDFDTTRRLAEIAVEQAIAQGKRVAVVAVGGLSGTTFREEIDPAQDHIASQSDDTWNRDILRLIEQARVEELNAEVGNFAQQAKADMGFKHLAWLLGAMGGRYRKAVVCAYGATWGAGAAVVEFKL